MVFNLMSMYLPYVIYSGLVISYSSCRDREMISIDSGSLVLLDPATAAERSLPAPRLGAPLAKMTRVWRVETHSDGVGADLPGVQVGPDVLPR